MVAELRYKPWGETRHTSGSTPATYHFTGQREDAGLGGLYFYNARWYEPGVGRFVQADTLVPQPGNPQAFNRYSYVLGNPLKYSDPSGYFEEDEIDQYLQNEYGDNWWAYKLAWQTDDVFWNMLLGATYGDILEAPTALGLGSGFFC